MKKEKSKLFLTITGIILVLAGILFGFTNWMMFNFGDVSFEQYFFGITAPSAGTPTSFYFIIAKYVGVGVLIAIVVIVLYYLILKKMNAKMFTKKLILSLVTLSLVVLSVLNTNAKVKISKFLFADETEFYEENYVVPSSSILKFPENKKNLIVIYLESFESTYFSKELGGDSDVNLLPNLTNLIEEDRSINFSHQDKLGGGYQAPETGYSIAGMFASQSGLPFRVPINGNDYGTKYAFVPGAVMLGDVLKANDYNLEFLTGADAPFAGVDNMYQTHGDWNIYDHTRAVADGTLPKDYFVWWGFEDSKLYQYSKERLDIVSKEDKPFAMVIETVDSHYPNGYLDESCPAPYDEPYANSVACTDKMVTDFIDYVKQQDYYEDTVIIVQGDHLSMEKDYFKNAVDPNYQRTIFNAYVNVDKDLVAHAKDKNRHTSTMDMFPTALAAMGVEIKGDQLGIGVNMFSTKPTLYEYYGVEKFNEELSKKSQYFYDEFLFKESTYK